MLRAERKHTQTQRGIQAGTSFGHKNQVSNHLLDRRRLLETVGVDTTQKLLTKLHGIESLDALVPVRLDVILAQSLILCRCLVPETQT